ncbi:hypothetical protein ACHAWU_006293 [Discostella pseudostelligera]|uniref:Uncharacterized protein n=1 Tax=Discostella pseudostelligera TaxID=259834 RepID=A0ABD3M889_9STRA
MNGNFVVYHPTNSYVTLYVSPTCIWRGSIAAGKFCREGTARGGKAQSAMWREESDRAEYSLMG